jgi:NAD(P)-dependent dehydrogenase (short-subunit alcohol dehydrogenase family)
MAAARQARTRWWPPTPRARAAWALRLIEDNIVVSAIAPGAFASEMNRDARDHGDEIAQHIPARRIGTDEDMAGAAIYLASRAGDYVVGSTLVVDGGVTCAR